MKVIGAGLPRTATTTQLVVLEQLGFGPCYHMRDLLADLQKGLPLWEDVAAGRPDWERIFGDAQSTVDWPAARYWRQLMDVYPEAKVLLSVREADGWVRSMRDTVWGIFHGDSVMHHVSAARTQVDPLWDRYIRLMSAMNWDERTGALAGDTWDDTSFAQIMERWNDQVKQTVPSERLLVWNPRDGWEPLCQFLEVDAPDGDVPRLNDTHAFREGIVGGALGALNEWWEARERPTAGLHGAAVK
jgi:sulfotransferase family protein